MKHIVTQSDLDENPELVTRGIQVGDEIELPEGTTNLTDEENPNNLEDDGEGDPPPGGNSPDKKPIIP